MASITQAICNDHRALAHDYEQILNAVDIDTATRWQNQFVWALVRHLVAKEQVLFPAFESFLGERGRFIVEKDRVDYGDINTTLLKFQSLHASTPEFTSVLQSLMETLGNHFNEEELADLPVLESALSPDQSRKLALSFENRKTFVPSRCHGLEGKNAMLGFVAECVVAPVDRLGDLWRRFPREGEVGMEDEKR